MMKIRARLSWLWDQWRGVWWIVRYPRRRKSAWINVGAWSFALAWVVLTLIANVIVRNFTWSWSTIIVGIFDFIMLHRSFEGLLWSYGRRK